ncbi:dynein light chain type 1 domain-containing protein [Ditylenchus destructor]|uniref:Dynein light chain type 1 domain-containing protein n=1 Tax=Ditylenchus destructor TaxID=166010 RepID=A0AAD4MJX9_9BILA|nr:dynein light chain type 1 domain-containing protein [Ditylenchus destructor]
MVMDTQIPTFVTGKNPSPPENDAIEPPEQNIEKNSLHEYEIVENNKVPKLDSCMSDAHEDSAHLEQAIRKINEKCGKMDKLCYQICSTSSPFSFEKNISEMHKYLEKLDQSSILSTPDTGICPKQVSTGDKTPNVPSQTALLDIERLRQELKQQIDALGQELMSKIEAKMSDEMNDVRAACSTTYWSGDESSSKIGSFIEESANRQLTECRDIIEQTPILRGALPGKKRGLRENTEKVLPDNVINLSEDLSTLEASVEHCNVFAETCDKPEASDESMKNTARDLHLTLKKQKTQKQSEVHLIGSNQTNRSSVEELHVEKDKLSHRKRGKDESEEAFDHRFYRALCGLFVLVLLCFAYLELKWTHKNWDKLGYYKASTEREIEDLKKSLDVEIEQRRKTESELKLAYENSKNFSQDKASTQREIEELRNSLYVEFKGRLKAENGLKLAQGNLEELRLDKEKAENDLKRKVAKEPFARSDVVIVKSEMSTEMQNYAIELMLESMKECTCAADVTTFIAGKMRKKYGSDWICFISNGKPNPIVLDNKYFLSVYLKMDVVHIELIA